MLLIQKRPDRAIVVGRLDERLDREAFPQFQSRFALVVAHRFQDRVVIRGIDHHGDRLVIFRRAPNHGRSPDVDLFDRFPERHARFRDGRFEWIEIHDDKIDWLETAFLGLRFVERVAAFVKQAAVHPRMQRLHAAFEHFRKIGEARNVAHRNAFLA